MENHIDQPLTLTVEQTAKVLGIGRSTAYELVHTGDIPNLRLGRRIVVPVGKLAECLGMAPNQIRHLLEPARASMAESAESRPEQPAGRRDVLGEVATLFWSSPSPLASPPHPPQTKSERACPTSI